MSRPVTPASLVRAATTSTVNRSPSLPLANDNVVKLVQVIEGTDADPSGTESFVRDFHVWLTHVIEVDLDRSFVDISLQSNRMPLIIPRCSSFVPGERQSRRILHDHDLTAVRVRLCTKVDIVKVGRILKAKKDTTIAMVARILRASDLEGDVEVPQLEILDQRNMSRAANRRLVVACSLRNLKRCARPSIIELPCRGIEYLPPLQSGFKVFFKNDLG